MVSLRVGVSYAAIVIFVMYDIATFIMLTRAFVLDNELFPCVLTYCLTIIGEIVILFTFYYKIETQFIVRFKYFYVFYLIIVLILMTVFFPYFQNQSYTIEVAYTMFCVKFPIGIITNVLIPEGDREEADYSYSRVSDNAV